MAGRAVTTETPDPEFLADPAELADWLGLEPDDPKVIRLLRAATRRFRDAVGHPVTQVVDDVVTLDGNGRESILLPVWPTTAVSEVLLDGEELTEGVDYQWSNTGALRRLCGHHWPNRLRCLRVTYTHGDLLVPGGVAAAVLEEAQIRSNVRPGVQSMTTGAQSITFGAQAAVGVTDTWSTAVNRHKVRESGGT